MFATHGPLFCRSGISDGERFLSRRIIRSWHPGRNEYVRAGRASESPSLDSAPRRSIVKSSPRNWPFPCPRERRNLPRQIRIWITARFAMRRCETRPSQSFHAREVSIDRAVPRFPKLFGLLYQWMQPALVVMKVLPTHELVPQSALASTASMPVFAWPVEEETTLWLSPRPMPIPAPEF
jgi:hypothetical protein